MSLFHSCWLVHFLVPYVQSELPLPSSTTDPSMATYLTKMWRGYEMQMRVRHNQMPPIHVEKDVLVFQVIYTVSPNLEVEGGS